MVDVSRTVEILFNAVDKTGDAFRSIGSNVTGAVDTVSKILQMLA